MKKINYISVVVLMAILSGCATPIDPALVKQHEAFVQRMQTRVIETNDRSIVTRGMILALQDLNFIINQADAERGVISAKKFGEYPIELSVEIKPISESLVSVHGIARYHSKTIEDPALYDQIFSSLQKSVSRVVHPVD